MQTSYHKKNHVFDEITFTILSFGTSKLIAYPGRNIKLLAQTEMMSRSNKIPKFEKFGNIVDLIIMNQGYFGFYRGIGFYLTIKAMNDIVYLLIGELSILNLYNLIDSEPDVSESQSHSNFNNLSSKFLAGLKSLGVTALSTSITLLFTQPLNYSRVKYVCDLTQNYRSLLDCILITYQENGIKEFYKGYFAAFIATILSKSLFNLLNFFKDKYIKNRISNKWNPIFDQIFRVVASVVVYPLNTLKNCMIFNRRTASILDEPKYTYTIFSKILEKKGVLGLYSGAYLNLEVSFVTSAIIFGFELLKAKV